MADVLCPRLFLGRATALIVGCYLLTVAGDLPSSCLTSLTTSNSVQCCRTQPFLEISFSLRFGCDVPHHLDEGVRLEIQTPAERWQAIRYYTPSLNASNVSIVRLNEDNTTVVAEALTYNSTFPLEVVRGNQLLVIHEYICDDAFWDTSFSIRWMQRYNERSRENVSTWSLDDVRIAFWNGECRLEVLSNTFNDNTTISNGTHYDVRAGSIKTLPCDSTSGSQLYFSEDANSKITARRSMTVKSLQVNTLECPPIGFVPDTRMCPVQECSSVNVCSIGSIQCISCHGSGYQPPANNTVGTCLDVDECENNNGGCQQHCVNSVGSYHCECGQGYALSTNGLNCTDVDECKFSNECQQVCINTNGSYFCACNVGFQLSSDQQSCMDVDECESSNCSQMCANTEGSYQCSCEEGFSLLPDNTTCQDIDECESSEHHCEQTCINQPGSYTCNCTLGFTLLSNGYSCQDVNECQSSNDCQQLCTNTNGSYSCACYVDVDECESSNCSQMCYNTEGSYQCSCEEGFSLLPDNTTCQDIDECESSEHHCEQTCINQPGSYTCNCSLGFTLLSNGYSCQDVNECQSSNDCQQLCTNTNGSYSCACYVGFQLSSDQQSCTDVDECEPSNCSQMCYNTEGSYQCSCEEGFSLLPDNTTCQDIDECESSEHHCEQTCVNQPGSYTCNCSLGYTLLSNGHSCQDIDECESSLNNCQHLCTNTNGSYVCSCNAGFQLSDDNRKCSVIPITPGFPDPQGVLGKLASTPNLPVTAVAERLTSLVSDLIVAGVIADRSLSMLFSKIVDDVLTTVNTTGDKEKQTAVSTILSVLDRFALRVYDKSDPDLETRGFQLRVMNLSVSSGRIEGIKQGSNRITLPALGNGVQIASFFFKDLSNALPGNPNAERGNNQVHAVPVVSSSVLCDGCNVSNLEEPVQYQLSVDNIDKEKALQDGKKYCYFYDLKLHDWSSDGCYVNTKLSNSTVVVCECSHLTHFAILLSPGLNLSEDQAFGLQVAGYVGVSISLFFLVLTVFSFALLKSLWGMRNFIHINLCISLFVAQLIFVTAIDKSHDEVLCQAIAVVLHYVFLVAFMWMLMEGVVLYVVLVQVFVKRQRLYMLAFALLSYGVPVVYMAVVVPLGFVLRDSNNKPHYGYEACWLRYDTGFVWAFISPVILIILVNIGFFVMAVYIMRKHTKRQTKTSHLKSLAQWLRSSVMLAISMGIPWIVGVLIFTKEFLFLAYIYTIFVALQGLVIFLLFVPFSKQVREGYKKWWRGKVSESDFLSRHFSSSDMNRKSSILGRFSSMKTSTLRVSHHDRSTFQSSHAEDNDIKLPDIPREKQSMSPPPVYEKYVQSQKVDSVGSDCKMHTESACGSLDPGAEDVNGTVPAQQNGVAVSGHLNDDKQESITEKGTMKFIDGVLDVNDCEVEATTL